MFLTVEEYNACVPPRVNEDARLIVQCVSSSKPRLTSLYLIVMPPRTSSVVFCWLLVHVQVNGSREGCECCASCNDGLGSRIASEDPTCSETGRDGVHNVVLCSVL